MSAAPGSGRRCGCCRTHCKREQDDRYRLGGTFTDVVSLRDGRIETAKISTDYDDVTKPILASARELGVADAMAFNHASTHGLNAVITRRLPKIGFLTTEGHRDILDMGRVWRPASRRAMNLKC